MTTYITQPSTENTQRLASFDKGSAIRTRKSQGNPMAKMGRGLRASKLAKLANNL